MWKKRLLKFFLWFLSGIAALVVTITVILWVYKDDIINLAVEEANSYLKVKVQVSKVDLTFWGSFPDLSVDFNDVFIQDALENADEFDTLLYTERIRCRFNPLDIWNETYTIKEVELGKGTLQLKVNDAGENNYDILKRIARQMKTKPSILNSNDFLQKTYDFLTQMKLPRNFTPSKLIR